MNLLRFVLIIPKISNKLAQKINTIKLAYITANLFVVVLSSLLLFLKRILGIFEDRLVQYCSWRDLNELIKVD